ncbi:MAG: hypothetical protein HQL13_04275 [Candidatus Omnitrophica bacterium]|nr:hypothetical protein [Candidatus Omnitrophota bacterium]
MFKTCLTISLCIISLGWVMPQVWSQDTTGVDNSLDAGVVHNIFIDVKDASLVNVLKIISSQTGLSFIQTSDVADKKITVYLNKVPLSKALQMILDANDLTYEMNGDVFVVKAKQKGSKNLITRVFQLKYATVSASKLNSTISVTSSSATSASTSSTSTTSSTAKGGTNGLEAVIMEALSPDGKVVEDTRTNSLIITDVENQFPNIESTIARIDVPVPQVLIEVEMLDVSKSTADALGITYGATPLTFTGGSMVSNWPFGPKSGFSNTNNSSSNGSNGSNNNSNNGSSSTINTGWNANGMTAALNFITNTTDARTLASPRILTINNETAQIEISTDQAISISQINSSTTSSLSQTSYQPERYKTGVILKVTPQANLLTREITMAVSPKVIDVILSQVQPPTGSSVGAIYDPETRGSDSILKLKDGQSMVIGGLMTNQKNTEVTKMPFLGDLPLLGGLFRSTTKIKSERELIIFLTPHIIEENNQLALKEGGQLISSQSTWEIKKDVERVRTINDTLDIYEKD